MTIWYIDPTFGVDTSPGNGSYSHPYRTAGKAGSVAVSGDEIVIKTGNHVLDHHDGWGYGAPLTKSITLRGETETRGDVVIDGSATYGFAIGLGTASISADVKDITFKNLVSIDGFVNFSRLFANDCSLNFIRCCFDSLWELCYMTSQVNPSVSFFMCEMVNIHFAVFTCDGYPSNFDFSLSKCLTATRGSVLVRGVLKCDGGNGSLNINNSVFVNREGSTFPFLYTGSTLAFTLKACTLFASNGGAFDKTGATTLVESDTRTDDPIFVDIDTEDWNLQDTSPCAWTGAF